jgi:hypothetical protein
MGDVQRSFTIMHKLCDVSAFEIRCACEGQYIL